MGSFVYICLMQNDKTPTTIQFETGKTYYSRRACLAGLPSGDFTVIKRNEKTLTIKVGAHVTRRNIITNADGVELVKYSGRATSLNVFADNR